jgi:hypothetical protein
MIFFISTKEEIGRTAQDSTTDYKVNTDQTAYKRIRGTIDTSSASVEASLSSSNPRQLLAWNQIYANVSDLKAAIIEEANNDKVCANMNAQAKDIYGIDILNDGDSSILSPTMDDTLNTWCHPAIANMAMRYYNKKRKVPQVPIMQLENWTISELDAIPESTEISTGATLALEDLYQETQGTTGLQPLTYTYGDQLRLVYDITELARALVGELTSNPSRRLEKLMAYKLCISSELESSLQGILTTYLAVHSIDDTFTSDEHKTAKWENFPQASDYLADATLKKLTEADLQDFLKQLLHASGLEIEAPDPTSEEVIEALEKWQQLPPVIRYGMLLHDFSRVLNPLLTTPLPLRANKSLLDDLASEDLSSISNDVLKEYSIHPHIVDTQPVLHLNDEFRLSNKRRSDAALLSWQTDEYNLPIRTYRQHLMPLWTGPSATIGGVMAFWMDALGDDFAVDDDSADSAQDKQNKGNAVAISAALFAVSTLYCDKRTGHCATGMEVLSSCLITPIIGDQSQDRVIFNNMVEANQDSTRTRFLIKDQSVSSDWYETVRNYAYEVNGMLVLEPLRIMALLCASFYENKRDIDYGTLVTTIKAAHAAVEAENYRVPIFVTRPIASATIVNIYDMAEKTTLLDAAV